MRVLVIGSGGREHALCWAIAASPLCDALYCAPGNPGIAEEATCVPVAATDIDGMLDLCRAQENRFRGGRAGGAAGRGAGGPARSRGHRRLRPERRRRRARRLQGLHQGSVRADTASRPPPIAAFATRDAASAYVTRTRRADRGQGGRARGRQGRDVAATARRGARRDRRAPRKFGAAGAELVIEEFLEGEEASFFALVDGKDALPLGTAQDHKRVGDGDTGPNTGGMGAYSPAPCLTPALEARGDGAHRPPDRGGDGAGGAGPTRACSMPG